MKKSNESPHTNCDEIEWLLVSKILDGITPDQNIKLEEHLKSCERCRSYQETLIVLQHTMQSGSVEKLEPDPAIKENIIKRMKAGKQREAGVLTRIWLSTKAMFDYRIPAYQAVFGLILVALVYFAVERTPSIPEQEAPISHSLTRMEVPPPAEMSVLDNLSVIDQQKIGRNVGEDTTLTRFIVSTM
jgi:predicted anti-sigma-YlaC factor YlaD